MNSSALAVGNHPVTAAFTSSASNTLDSGSALAGGQTVQRADTQTSVTSSRNPSELGQTVTFTAQVDAVSPGAGTPGGSVQFSDNGSHLASPQSLDGSGRASIATAGLTVGVHTITATNTPVGGSYNESSGSASQTVERAATTLTRQYDASPIAGKPVHFTVSSQSCDGITDASGRASCAITPQEPAGGFTVAASFAGDAGSRPSSDSTAYTVTREQDVGRLHGRHGDRQRCHRARLSAELHRAHRRGRTSGVRHCRRLPAARPWHREDGVRPGRLLPRLVRQRRGHPLLLPEPRGLRGRRPQRDDRGVGLVLRVAVGQGQLAQRRSGPSAFKGFATAPGTPPGCGGSFTADPGNSGSPPVTVPS